jgi:hypothetical protein
MVATVSIIEKNGAGGTETVKTSGTVRFKNADNATVDTNNPLVIPTSPGFDYSFKKWLRAKVTAPPDVQISNLKAYSDGGGFGTGIAVWAAAITAYATPAEADATDLDSPSLYADLFGYTAGSPLSLGAGPFAPESPADSPYDDPIGDHLVLFMTVEDTATQGALTPETLTIAYDEI